MPRFIVSMCDKSDGQILTKIVKATSKEEAILEFPWLVEIYTEKWIINNICENTEESIISNLHNVLNWSCSCVNLDEEILKDLNGGDSSASLSNPATIAVG